MSEHFILTFHQNNQKLVW